MSRFENTLYELVRTVGGAHIVIVPSNTGF